MSEPLRLNVLPHSGKVDQLRAEAASQPPRAVAAPVTSSDSSSTESSEPQTLEAKIIDAIRGVYDPEIPINIYELGLIYSIDISDTNDVHVTMTLTAPTCPVAGTLPAEVEKRIAALDGVASAKVELVWQPAWSRDRMSEAALLELGLL